jgi:hypothetical protein
MTELTYVTRSDRQGSPSVAGWPLGVWGLRLGSPTCDACGVGANVTPAQWDCQRKFSHIEINWGATRGMCWNTGYKLLINMNNWLLR